MDTRLEMEGGPGHRRDTADHLVPHPLHYSLFVLDKSQRNNLALLRGAAARVGAPRRSTASTWGWTSRAASTW